MLHLPAPAPAEPVAPSTPDAPPSPPAILAQGERERMSLERGAWGFFIFLVREEVKGKRRYNKGNTPLETAWVQTQKESTCALVLAGTKMGPLLPVVNISSSWLRSLQQQLMYCSKVKHLHGFSHSLHCWGCQLMSALTVCLLKWLLSAAALQDVLQCLQSCLTLQCPTGSCSWMPSCRGWV